MALHLPQFHLTQTQSKNFKGHKTTLSSLMRTQHLKRQFIKISDHNRQLFFDSSTQSYNPQKVYSKFNSHYNQNKSDYHRNDLSSLKSQELNRYSQYDSFITPNLSKTLKKQTYYQKKLRQSKQLNLLHKLKMKNSAQNIMISTSRQHCSKQNQKLNQKQNQKSYFTSGNLQNKMNQYLNILLHKSDQQFQEKLKKIQQQAQFDKIKKERKRYASQNHYYKVMKASDIKRKKRIKSPEFYQQQIINENQVEAKPKENVDQKALKQHLKFKSQLFRKTQKIISERNKQLKGNVNSDTSFELPFSQNKHFINHIKPKFLNYKISINNISNGQYQSVSPKNFNPKKEKF